MKKFRSAWAVVLCLTTFCFISCSKEDPIPDPELVISVEQISFSNAGETKSFHIKANTSWQVSSNQTWCTLAPASGVAGTIKVDAIAAKNETATSRTAIITATAGELSKQITITQEAAILLTLAQTEYVVDMDGKEIIVSVQSSGAYAVEIVGNWITSIAGSGTTNPKFKIDVNPGLVSRSGTITFLLGGISKVVTINQTGNPLTIVSDNIGMGSDAMTLAQKMDLGWNLGNSLEAMSNANGVYSANETMWGNAKTSKTLIDAVKAAGFNTVRLPCAWTAYIEDQTTYRIKDSWMSRVKEVVDYCVANDMYAIVNIHWDGGWLEEHPLYSHQVEVNKKQKALWEQIAVAFRNYDEHLLFAGTNEVHANYGNPTAENIEVQQSYNQTFVNAVRSTGGKNTFRNLIVQGYNTNIDHTDNNMVMPSDATSNRLMAEIHFYDPYDFTLDATSTKYLWGAAFAGNPNTPTWGQEDLVDQQFAKMKTKFIDHNIPVVLGEYAATLRTSLTGTAYTNHLISRNNYLHYVTKAAIDNGFVPVYWDNGATGNNSSGLFNRATGQQVYSDAINAIISAAD
jgi:endoglucanase